MSYLPKIATTDYEAGQEAYFMGQYPPNTHTPSAEWMRGWRDAENDPQLQQARRENLKATARVLRAKQARKQARVSKLASTFNENRTDPNWGSVYGGSGPSFMTPQGPVWMHRKGQKVRFFDILGNQVGPEQANVAPAMAYAYAQPGWQTEVNGQWMDTSRLSSRKRASAYTTAEYGDHGITYSVFPFMSDGQQHGGNVTCNACGTSIRYESTGPMEAFMERHATPNHFDYCRTLKEQGIGPKATASRRRRKQAEYRDLSGMGFLVGDRVLWHQGAGVAVEATVIELSDDGWVTVRDDDGVEGFSIPDRLEKIGSRKRAMPNPVDLGISVGDFFVNSWGYDQTNVDFYEVVALTGASVRLKPVATRWVEDGSGRGYVPVPGSNHPWKNDLLLKRVQQIGNSEPFVRMDHGWTSLWDGRPVSGTAPYEPGR